MQFQGVDDSSGEDYVVCPYNPLHVIRVKRLPYHLRLCRKSFTNLEMETCPYNATHVYPRVEHQYHITHCRDRAIIDHEMLYNQPDCETIGQKFRGNCSLPDYDYSFETEDSWDNDVDYSQPSVSVMPPAIAAPRVLNDSEKAAIGKRFEGLQRNRDSSSAAGASGPVVGYNVGVVNGGATASDSTLLANGASHNTDAYNGRNQLYQSTTNATVPVPCPTFVAGIGRGHIQHSRLPGAAPFPQSTEPVASFGRGRPLNEVRQQRRVTTSAAFPLSGIGRGIVKKDGLPKP